jgi:hypothetical protein
LILSSYDGSLKLVANSKAGKESLLTNFPTYREELREQHAIGEEIGEAITQSIGNQGLDESELDDELEALQQEELDSQMLTTGSVPVGDKVGALPAAPQGGLFHLIHPIAAEGLKIC